VNPSHTKLALRKPGQCGTDVSCGTATGQPTRRVVTPSGQKKYEETIRNSPDARQRGRRSLRGAPQQKADVTGCGVEVVVSGEERVTTSDGQLSD